MLFKKKITLWGWSSSDDRWTEKIDAEAQIDRLLKQIANLKGIKVSPKQYYSKEGSDHTVTEYVFVKLIIPLEIHKSFEEQTSMSNVVFGSRCPKRKFV
ncbi:MAG: hypothetical protein J6I85_02215 [Clostridia bacterium]|nr:hypothetical protein [Clostridia bacterium]